MREFVGGTAEGTHPLARASDPLVALVWSTPEHGLALSILRFRAATEKVGGHSGR